MSTRMCQAEGCGRPIRFVLSEAGKSIPIDPDPHPDGTVVAVPQPDGSSRARVLTGRELPAQETAWRAHWTTCPGSDDYRRRKARTAKACARTGCRTPLDDVLVTLGLTMHPGCEDGDPLPHERPVATVVRRGEASPTVATGPAPVEAPTHGQLDLLGPS